MPWQSVLSWWSESPREEERQFRSYGLVLAIFVFLLVIALAASWSAIEIVDSTRAYVNSESQHSRAEKGAVLSLHRYAYSGRPGDYRNFLEAISIPLGDRIARRALESSPPNVAVAARGFLAARNHPDDVDGMIRFFRRFSWWGPFAAAIVDWRRADLLVTQLVATGAELQRLTILHRLDETSRSSLLSKIEDLDARLTELEDDFSNKLGQAARTETMLLVLGLGITTIALWAIGVAFATHLFRKQLDLDRQLTSSEARFRDFAEVASDWYWESDAGNRMTYLSERFYVQAGVEPGSRTDQDCTTFVRERAASAQYGEVFLLAIREHMPFRDIHLCCQHRDGYTLYFSIAGKPHFDGAGNFLGFRGVGSDITATVRDSQSLREAKERAEILNHAKSEFLANMSHELRTPLNAIMGFAEMISSRLLGPQAIDRYVEYAADIRESGKHLLSIVDDVLDLSKIEAGHTKLRECEVRLDRITDAVKTLVGDRIERTGLLFNVDIPNPPPHILVDERKLIQILLNLLSNALKFTAPGGEIALNAMITADAELAILVRDTGIGIASKDIDTILSPFGQVESAFRRTHHGTGLGLPLAKSLTELHGGSLRLESSPGVGTTVIVTLPARRLLQRNRANAGSAAATKFG